MADLNNVLQRIDAEFNAARESVKEFQQREVAAHVAREKRLEQFPAVCDSLKDVWRPRLEALSQRFAEKGKLTPNVSSAARAAELAVTSPLAQIVLKFSATTDFEVHNLVLNYDLHVLPILMKYEPHAQAEFPLNNVDREAVARWIDDRMVDFVKTYLAIHKNEYYLKGKTVTDPVSGTEFPKYAAVDSLEYQGKMYHFIGVETRREFQKRNNLSIT